MTSMLNRVVRIEEVGWGSVEIDPIKTPAASGARKVDIALVTDM